MVNATNGTTQPNDVVVDTLPGIQWVGVASQNLITSATFPLAAFTIFQTFKNTGQGYVYEHGDPAVDSGSCVLTDSQASNGNAAVSTTRQFPTVQRAQEVSSGAGTWGTTGLWMSVCHRYDGTQAGGAAEQQLYFSGVSKSLVASAVDPGSTTGSAYTLRLGSGKNFPTYDTTYTGYTRDFIVYSRALTSTEITNVDSWMRGRVGL